MQGVHPGFFNPGQMSPEVQNRGISGSTKRTIILQKINENKFISAFTLAQCKHYFRTLVLFQTRLCPFPKAKIN